MSEAVFVGIDIAKEHLDVFVLPKKESWTCENDADGVTSLIGRHNSDLPDYPSLWLIRAKCAISPSALENSPGRIASMRMSLRALQRRTGLNQNRFQLRTKSSLRDSLGDADS